VIGSGLRRLAASRFPRVGGGSSPADSTDVRNWLFFWMCLCEKPNRVDGNCSAEDLRCCLIMSNAFVELFDRRQIYKTSLVQHRTCQPCRIETGQGGSLRGARADRGLARVGRKRGQRGSVAGSMPCCSSLRCEVLLIIRKTFPCCVLSCATLAHLSRDLPLLASLPCGILKIVSVITLACQIYHVRQHSP
jgi:hypothetical protein